MTGKICLVTGGTNGIGKQTALELAKMGATVVIVGRDKTRTDAAVAEIKQQSGSSTVDSLLADLSLMSEVRRLAADFRARYKNLHVLINNAGAVFTGRKVTSEGLEMTFALNHMSYFILTNELLDIIKASAPARIVNVSSDAHSGPLNFDDLQHAKSYSAFSVYGHSKLENILFTYELSRRLAGTGVTANALHPGFVRSGFGRNNALLNLVMGVVQRLFAISVEKGAETSVYLATSPEVEGVTGKYFDEKKAKQSIPVSYDQATWTRLWDISEKLAAVPQPAR